MKVLIWVQNLHKEIEKELSEIGAKFEILEEDDLIKKQQRFI
jgi:hypothetical protein